MTTWVASPAYGSVALGPVQSAVLELALRLTEDGRRPELTLERIAAMVSRSVSSVHDALGRLRALGLLGVSARMGRHGGHRLWRVRPPRAELDAAKHRRAIARIARRFGIAYAEAVSPRPTPEDRPGGTPPPSEPSSPTRGAAPGGSSAPDPFGVTPRDWSPPPADETFAEKLRRHGLGDWIGERHHGDDR